MEGIKLDIKIMRGTDFFRNIALTDNQDNFINLSGYKFIFAVKPFNKLDEPDTNALIYKEITSNDNVAVLHLTPEDTNIEVGKYFYTLKTFFPDGREKVFLYGDFEIEANAVRRT